MNGFWDGPWGALMVVLALVAVGFAVLVAVTTIVYALVSL